MIPHLYILGFPLLAAVAHVSAFHVAVRGVPPHLAKRDPISGLINVNGSNMIYLANGTLGGQQVQVQIDTGR